MGSLIDTKGNKIAGFDSIDKKQARVNGFFPSYINISSYRSQVTLLTVLEDTQNILLSFLNFQDMLLSSKRMAIGIIRSHVFEGLHLKCLPGLK